MKHARLTDRLREQAALYALGALPPDQHARVARHLADDGCAACRAEVDDLTATGRLLALAAPAVPPAAGLRARVLAGARAATPFRYVLRSEGEWIQIQPGVFRKNLDAGPGGTSFLLRLEPGAQIPPHRHAGDEHCYIVEGDARLAGRQLHAGDFHLAAGGTTHEPTTTDGGCLLVIVQSPASA